VAVAVTFKFWRNSITNNMKRKNLKGYAAVVALVAAALGGCGAVSEPPVSVEREQDKFGPFVKVTSVVNEITVTDIKLNRGNCGVTRSVLFMGSGPLRDLPITLKFGEDISKSISSCENLIETTIATNKGDFVFNFQQ